MKFLFLYAEVTGYLMGCLRALGAQPQVSGIVVYQNLEQPQNDFRVQDKRGIQFRSAIGRSVSELWAEMAHYQPDAVYVSGWMFPKYYQLAQKLRTQGAVLILGSDTPWEGTFRQWLGTLSSPFWLSSLYEYMWVPGDSQYLFARRLGFEPKQIYKGLLSADTAAFFPEEKPVEKPIQTLLSVGSFVPRKGMPALVEAFRNLQEEGLSGWELHLVGGGPQKDLLEAGPGIRVTPFVQPDAIPEIFASAAVFALASLREPWGVVVHEAAFAGLPLLLSGKVGAAADLLEEGKNGLLFNPHSPEDLSQKMAQLLTTPAARLAQMGAHSRKLAQKFSPERWAETFLQMAQRKPAS